MEIISSKGDQTYLVLVNPWGNNSENICCCIGYNMRGTCRHQTEASLKVCRWDSRDKRSPVQAKPGVCPNCLGRTKTEIEIVG